MKRCLRCYTRFESDGWRCPSCGHDPPTNGRTVLFAPEAEGSADGFDPGSFEHLPAIEERSFWFRSRNELIVWALRRYAPSAQSVLELGCGTGFVLAGIQRALPYLELAGSELHQAGLVTAEARVPKAAFYQMDARAIPFVEEFDVIGAFDVIEHVDQDELVLAEAFRALRPGGVLLITVPQHRWLWSDADDYAHHKRRYDADDLRRKLSRAGYAVARSTSFVSLLLPVLAVSRWRQRKGLEQFDPLAEYGQRPLVDSTLGWIMGLERTSIELGLSLPAGGSLLVVASRP
jgi:SAM-dependent methyltransferase